MSIVKFELIVVSDDATKEDRVSFISFIRKGHCSKSPSSQKSFPLFLCRYIYFVTLFHSTGLGILLKGMEGHFGKYSFALLLRTQWEE